jgi:hypothetical protein
MIDEDDDIDQSFGSGPYPHEDEESRTVKKPKYIDNQNPALRSVGQRILDSALHEADQNYASLDELWMVFMRHVRGYEFADQIALQFQRHKDEVVQSIKNDCYDELRRVAYSELRDQVKPQVLDELREELASTVRSELHKEMREEVKKSIRADLLSDAKLIQEVKDELKRRIVGL